MNRSLRLFMGLSGLLMTCGLLCGQGGIPQYCKTDAGVLGPYPNDGSVKVGDPCYGTKNGQRYEGVAVMSKSSRSSGDDNGGDSRGDNSGKGGVPHYCKTEAGVLGPYPNDGTVKVGDACYGTKNGQRYEGVAVASKSGGTGDDDSGGDSRGDNSGKGSVTHYCKTDAGVLGPYPNDGSVKVGDACYGTKNGQRYEGVAVMSKSSRSSDDDNGGDSRGDNSGKGGVPHYCKTEAGVLGPYPNDGSLVVGDACYGTKNGRRYEGVAVMSRTDN